MLIAAIFQTYQTSTITLLANKRFVKKQKQLSPDYGEIIGGELLFRRNVYEVKKLINALTKNCLFKEKQFLKFFIESDTDQQRQSCAGTELVIFDRADGLS